MQGLMDDFVVRTKRKAPENPTGSSNGLDDKAASSRLKNRVARKRPRALPASAHNPATPSPLWSDGVQAGTVWSYVIDALIDRVPPSRIVRVIRTLGALSVVSRLVHDVLHVKRIRIDVLTTISQDEGCDSPSKPITVMCSAVPLARAGLRRKLVFDLYTDTDYEGVSLMVAHGMFASERHWYRARTGLLCRRPADNLCEKAARYGNETDSVDEGGVGRIEDDRLFWPTCERMIEMPLSHLLWDEIVWTNKAPWKDEGDEPPKDPIDDRKGCDLESDDNQDEDRLNSAHAEKDDDKGGTRRDALNGVVDGDDDGDDGDDGDDSRDSPDDRDDDSGDDQDDDDDEDEDRHDDEFGKWVSFADGRWSMCIFHDYHSRMSLYKVSVRL